jgi:agmatinase
MVVIAGVPWDEHSSFMRGSALAPASIREALHGGSMNLCAENGIDLGMEPRFRDLGDLELDEGSAVLPVVEKTITALLARDVYILSLGGDHAITYPIVKAFARKYTKLNILHLDAHPDLYDEYGGNRHSHACPLARIMEKGLAERLVQVGIRTMNPHQRAQAERFGAEVIEMRDWQPGLRLAFDGPLYLSLDMDVLDPAYAPGVSHHEPGGLSTRDVIRLIQGLRAPIVGADVVEVNPKRDPGPISDAGCGITAMVAAKLLKEIVACMLELNGY